MEKGQFLLVKGSDTNDGLLKRAGGGNYFDKLLQMQKYNRIIATIITLALLQLNLHAQTNTNDSLLNALHDIDLPLINIVTDGNVNPSFTRIDAPEGCFGVGITNNEFCTGRMTITHHRKLIYDSGDYKPDESGMRIRVRGNTSAVFNRQTPYKLKLSLKADLMMREDPVFRSKDWALLSPSVNGNLMFIPLGTEVARLVCTQGEGKQPEVRFVNVVLNGEYIGPYNLMETIERGTGRIDINKSGFIIENDAYWWNQNGAYFRCANQPPTMAFTFKYPDFDKVDATRVKHISDFMESALTALYADGDVSAYFDLPTFAQWVLAHDIMGTTDAAGTNMYYVMDAMDDDGHAQSLLKAGPLWDFGCIMRASSTDWSNQHREDLTFYPQMFKNETFVREYANAFERIKPTFICDLTERIDSLSNTYGQALTQSILLDNPAYANIDGQNRTAIRYLKKRIDTIEQLINRDFVTVGIHANEGAKAAIVRRTDLMGKDFTKEEATAIPHGIYIEMWSDGTVTKVLR